MGAEEITCKNSFSTTSLAVGKEEDMMSTKVPMRTIPTIEPDQVAQYEQLYGRNLTPVEAEIVHIWSTTTKPACILAYPDIPQKKLDNALRSYAAAASRDVILGLYDTSLLGSGKEGILFTTFGIYWHLEKNNIFQNSKGSIRYLELNPDVVACESSFANRILVLTEKHRLSLVGTEEEMAGLVSFVRNATQISHSNPPETCWEFSHLVVEGKAQSVKKCWSLDEVKEALTSHDVQTHFLYRKYNPRRCTCEKEKGEWKPIPDDLFQKVGISKEVLTKAEKRHFRITLTIIASLLVVLVIGVGVGVLFLAKHAQGPQTPAHWGALIFGTLGVITGSLIVFKNPLFRIISIIVGITFVLKNCTGP